MRRGGYFGCGALGAHLWVCGCTKLTWMVINSPLPHQHPYW